MITDLNTLVTYKPKVEIVYTFLHVYVGHFCKFKGHLLKFREEGTSTIEMILVTFRRGHDYNANLIPLMAMCIQYNFM